VRRVARGTATSLQIILVTALALRLGYAWEEQRRIPHVDLAESPFLYEPGAIAYSLAVGKGFSSPFRLETGPTAWTTPTYPFLLAGIFEIFGTYTFPAFVAAALLNILFSALTCAPLFYAGKRIGGIALGAGAAWLWAVFPSAVIIPFQWIWDTSLSGLLAATILWTTLVVADSARLRNWCAYGLLWGLALMTHATLLSGLPPLLGWMTYRVRAGQRSACWLAKPALTFSAIVLCCVPWTIRNYVVFRAFVPFRSALGLQLWLGNNDQYRDEFPGWLHPIDSPAERAKYVRLGEIAYMREKRHEAIQWMLSHPRREAELFEDRFIATWLGTPHPLEDFRRSPSLLVRAVFVSNVLAAGGALFGIILLFRTPAYRLYGLPVAAFPVLYPFAYYLSQASLRYRYPIDPIVLLLVVIAAERLSRGVRSMGPGKLPFLRETRSAPPRSSSCHSRLSRSVGAQVAASF
jgi:Dolichyl-phosphate-mannose-protein mannosyltransferase